jgi:EF hand
MQELRGATSLLVLATVRRAADDSAVSRATVEGMFREADANNDGQLTFQEWFTWLGAAPTSSYQLTAKSEPSLLDGISGENNKSSTGSETTGWLATVEVDPMVEALSLVLSNAVCTLKTTARITQDPSILAGNSYHIRYYHPPYSTSPLSTHHRIITSSLTSAAQLLSWLEAQWLACWMLQCVKPCSRDCLNAQGLFCCVVLCCVVLCCVVLCCAVLCCAVLCCAVLCCAVLCCAVLC